MKIIKYTSIALVALWVVMYNEARSEDLIYNPSGIIKSNYDNNELKSKYFNLQARLNKSQKDINFYRNRRLEIMSTGDFDSQKYKRLSSLISQKEFEIDNLTRRKRSLGVTYFVKPEAKYLTEK
ncbi:MAG: hypothetical protein EBU90_13740 [Proteobacteria bacterium]|nr:hypothetical protein [Pseudomonadota bacterium]